MTAKISAKHIFKKIFLDDWALKMLALVITLALWLGVTGLSTRSARSLTVPLNSSISNDAIITNTLRQEVEIVLSGDNRNLDQINRSDISASIDLTAVAPGDWVIQLSPDTVSVNNLPQGLVLKEVRPGNMAVKLEAVAERDIVVNPETSGFVARGFEIYSTTVQPPIIRVRGPSSIMKLLDYVQTDKIDIADRKEAFTARQIAVVSPNPKAAVLNTVVDVFFSIGERRVERSFSLPLNDAGRKVIFAVYGPRTLLAKLRADEIKVEMPSTGVDDEQVSVVLPAELRDMCEIRKLRVSSLR